MFAIRFRRLIYVGDKIIARNLRGRKLAPDPNPGLQKRLDEFHKEGFKVQENDAEEFVEQSDSDFYHVGEAYNEHLSETVAGKLDIRRHIVKEKYFKENMPNLLTWSEKEQIRHLAATEPDEWTPERIAESFPVTVPVVKKLLKYVWKPATEERIARHDASAMRNWRELKEGSLHIPEDLQQHFLKFVDRTIPPLRHKPVKIDLTPDKNLGEFESIIRRCAAKEETNHNQKQQPENENVTTELEVIENHKRSLKRDCKRTTLDDLAEKIKKRLEKGNNIDINDSIMIKEICANVQSTPVAVSSDITREIELPSEDSKSTEENRLTQFKENDSKVQVPDYVQRIRIPKKAYKKGATYKVNDCYYDDDGKFLYRVLGMEN